MAFNFNNAMNSGLALRPRPPPPPPPPQVGPLQIRGGFQRNHPHSELDAQQQQQMLQQQLMQMISGGHPMLPPGQLVLGPQGFPLPPLMNEMHPPPLMKDPPPVDINHALPVPPIKSDIVDSQNAPNIVNLDSINKRDSHNDQNDKAMDKTERRRKRDRWGNQTFDRDQEPSEENYDKEDDQSVQSDVDLSKLGNVDTAQTAVPPNEGRSNQMWPGLMQQMGNFPVLGVNPMGMVDPAINPLMFGMMQQEGSLMDPNLFAPGSTPSTKEIMECKDCTLFPPNPNMSVPSTRKRPPGCKTIFVGGLPEKATEDMVREIFNRFGEISSIRLNNLKKFCHIRYADMSSIDAALYLSGYRMKIGQSSDTTYNGRLHVDFAQARDDQHDWECQLRQIQREQRHREKQEQERVRVPSPPPVPHFNESEANALVEKIKAENTFLKATSIAVAWLERGECNKRVAHVFYCMIQSTNAHVRRITTEKAQCEEELRNIKESTKSRIATLQTQFNQIERVFTSALHKKAWDHFTKAQRKNIETWKKLAMDIKSKEFQESSIVGGDEEMEVSDSEEETVPRKKKRESSEPCDLKEENDSLRCQLEAYKNEIDLIRLDHNQELENKEKESKIIQQALKGTQQQLLESKLQQMQKDTKIQELLALLAAKSDEGPERSFQEISEEKEADSSGSSPVTSKISGRDAKLIGLISMFLHVHPFGAGVDYIWSFLQKLEPSLKPNEVETLMSRFPSVFLQELVGIGANMERRWQFIGFKPVSNSSAS